MLHGHPHAPARPRAKKRLFLAAVLTALLAVGEFLGGLLSGSLSLISDAGHMLADLSALLLSLLSIIWATKPAGPQKTFGYYRIEILASLVNAALLFFVAFHIFWEAVERMDAPRPIDVAVMLPVAAAGLAVNVLSIFLLRHEKEHLVARSALFHVIADTISSVGVVAASILIYFTGLLAIDTGLSALIACMIVFGAYRLLREALDILLEASPAHIPLEEVRKVILSVPDVLGTHDLHVWTISSGFHAASAHVCVRDMALSDSETVVAAVNRALNKRFSITHTTIQVTAASPAKIRVVPRPSPGTDAGP